MKTVAEFQNKISFLLTDIDDTLTDQGRHHGRLGPEAYQALWDLDNAGIKVIPVTGRPAGWCELIARLWPVAGVIGENGAFYFRHSQSRMNRFFSVSQEQFKENQKKLEVIEKEILSRVPGSAVASDQFSRISDLAIDFCEDVPALSEEKIEDIVQIFLRHGAQAKISSIHVNGWFGEFNKLTCALEFLTKEFQLSSTEILNSCAFVGDSPNDEPMWKYFPHSFGVANVQKFNHKLKHPPQYVAQSEGGMGFAEIAQQILSV